MKDKLWFKAKTYGYGWTPCSWEGWAVMVLYLCNVLIFLKAIDNHSHTLNDTLLEFVLPYISLTIFLIAICIFKGEKPSWRWGDKSKMKN